jgi:hypothetical protein
VLLRAREKKEWREGKCRENSGNGKNNNNNHHHQHHHHHHQPRESREEAKKYTGRSCSQVTTCLRTKKI